jgi:RecJ-like exonuclease
MTRCPECRGTGANGCEPTVTCETCGGNGAVDVPASDQLRKEIHLVIRRYGEESDVTVYQAVGVLEIGKLDLVEMLERAKE